MPQSASRSTRTRRQRGSISAEEIVNGAFEVARGGSLDQLSMPTLAEHLGVGVTSIYWYFRKKQDLLNAMTDVAVDKVAREIQIFEPDTPWQQVISEYFASQRRIHGEDEILSDLLMIRTSTYSRDATRRVFELVEGVVAHLVAAGFTPANALRVFNTISVYTRGVIIHGRILQLSNAPTLDGRQKRMTDWSSMPILASLLDDYDLAGTRDEDFEFGVRRLICGFEVLLREQEAHRPKKAASARNNAVS